MDFPLFSRVALSVDLPLLGLKAGDVATIVDSHTGGNKRGYSLEFFNAKGETIMVTAVEETQIEPLRHDEIFHVRHLHKIAA